MPESTEISLFEGKPPLNEDAAPEDLAFEGSLSRSHKDLLEVLPDPITQLAAADQAAVVQQHRLELLLGSAGSAVLRCEETCPFVAECSYALANAQPIGQKCPHEVVLVREKFLEWMREIGCSLETIGASERLAIGELVSYEIELQRVRRTLSRAQNAEMSQLSVRDVNAETGAPICWENIIHISAQREEQIVLSMRMILKDFELTPEQKTKRARALGIRSGNNLASKQSKMYDKIKARGKAPVIDTFVAPNV